MDKCFQDWLHTRTNGVNEAGWHNLVPGVTSGVKDWKAQRNLETERQSRWRQQLSSKDRLDLVKNPNNALKYPGVDEATNAFIQALDIPASMGKVQMAARRIAAARIIGLPLRVSKADVKTILDALWWPQGKKEPLAVQNNMTNLDHPGAILELYTSSGIDSAPPYNGGRGEGKWSAESGFNDWDQQIMALPGRYREWLLNSEKSLAHGQAEIDQLRSGGRGGGGGKGGLSVLPGDIGPALKAARYTNQRIQHVKDYLAQIAALSVGDPLPPATRSVKRALEILGGKGGTP